MLFALPLAASRASDGDVPLEFLAPPELASQAMPAKGPADQPAVEVTGGATVSTTTILVCNDPPVSTERYAVRGKIRYEGVAGDGYLELWNDFGPQGKFFTRSLASWGGLQKLSGTSNWRDFELPFYANPGMKPRQLTLNVVLPGAGKVVVMEPQLIAANSSTEWWTELQAGWIGGGLGSALGVLGALIGVFSSRGKLRGFTLSLFGVGLAVGSALLLAGIVAVLGRQPWHVYYPLLLVGVIDVAVLGGNLWMLLGRYRNDELRRITAVDA
jgi:hypothetical protein